MVHKYGEDKHIKSDQESLPVTSRGGCKREQEEQEGYRNMERHFKVL